MGTRFAADLREEAAMQRHSELDDPVRAVTDPTINARIDRAIDACVAYYRGRPQYEIDGRIDELAREWDLERWLEVNASLLSLTGLALGVLRHRAWLGLPFMVSAFLLQHAIRGWCPPVPLFRRLGVRTRKEIDREMYSLKSLRGDFADMHWRAASGAAGVRPVLGGVTLQRQSAD
jgi:hypothetical protein